MGRGQGQAGKEASELEHLIHKYNVGLVILAIKDLPLVNRTHIEQTCQASHVRLVQFASLLAGLQAALLQDSPAPSGNSQAATVLARMAAYTGEARYLEAGTRAVEAGPGLIERAPVMFGQWLTATLLLERGTREVAVVGELTGTEGAALLAEIRSALRPDLIVAARPAGRPTVVPLLEDREPATGLNAVAWVCSHATCMPPTGDPTELAALLQQ